MDKDSKTLADELIAKHLETSKDDNHCTAKFYAHQSALREALDNMKDGQSSQEMIYWMNVGEAIANQYRNL